MDDKHLPGVREMDRHTFARPQRPEDVVTMAQPQSVDMSKLSPAEKEAMMQQVFANATTVRPRRDEARKRDPPEADASLEPVLTPPDETPGHRRRWSIASSCSTSACSVVAPSPRAIHPAHRTAPSKT